MHTHIYELSLHIQFVHHAHSMYICIYKYVLCIIVNIYSIIIFMCVCIFMYVCIYIYKMFPLETISTNAGLLSILFTVLYNCYILRAQNNAWHRVIVDWLNEFILIKFGGWQYFLGCYSERRPNRKNRKPQRRKTPNPRTTFLEGSSRFESICSFFFHMPSACQQCKISVSNGYDLWFFPLCFPFILVFNKELYNSIITTS